ncbi:MAG: hypothetical protein IT323_22645 [Anaerolineae bacterium]|nr:hypothetical protein [Anaerolineae bacterium]
MSLKRIPRTVRQVAAVMLVIAALSAALPALAQGDTPTPRPTRTPLPSVTPPQGAPPGLPTGAPGPTATLAIASTLPGPTATSPLLAASPTPLASPEPTQPLVLPGDAPPFGVNLPRGWQYAYQYVPIRTAYDAVMMGVAIYQGPVTNGVGTIIALWGFPSIAPPPSLSDLMGANASATPETPTPGPEAALDDLSRSMLWTDGLRLLQGTVVDITCNVGTSGQQPFSVGGQPAVGTYFNITGCQGEPDTAGWFAGVKSGTGNVLFYAYVEPIEAYNDARGDLQAVLDSIRFAVVATPTPTPAP